MMKFKKTLAILLLFTLLLALLAGCAKKEQIPVGTISDFESQAHISVDTSEEEFASGDTSKAPVSGDFVVSEKKYDYKDANIMLLYVENKTNRHFNVTIHGTYLDENGEVIKEEKQTYEGFPAGWSNHFIFYPKTAFNSFTYTVDTEEYVPDELTCDESGTPYASFIDFTYEKRLYWSYGGFYVRPGDDPYAAAETVRRLDFDYTLNNSHPTTMISAQFHLLLLDEDGNVYATDFDAYEMNYEMGLPVSEEAVIGTACGPLGSEDDGKITTSATVKTQKSSDGDTIPENVQGKFNVVFAVLTVDDLYVSWDRQGVLDDILASMSH